MKKYFPIAAILTLAVTLLTYFYLPGPARFIYRLLQAPAAKNREYISSKTDRSALLEEAMRLLKVRQDSAALADFERVLSLEPENIEALWGKAEVLRRNHEYALAEDMLSGILTRMPQHNPSLIGLSLLRYGQGRLDEVTALARQVLCSKDADKKDQALAYIMLGSANGKRAMRGGLLSKIKYGTSIRSYFLKAKQLADDLPETHLALGTFYLSAPAIVGGNLQEAIKELELALKLAEPFATTNIRLAQAYQKKGDLQKYNFYIRRAKELDPRNELFLEMIE